MTLELLRALVLSIWTASGIPHTSDEIPIATAIAQAVDDDADNAPVYSSHDEDAAALAVWVITESNVHTHPRAFSWDAIAGVSCGAFQTSCFVTRSQSLAGQAKYVLRLWHLGSTTCPEQPMAPAIGGCKAARKQGDFRVRWARELLRAVLVDPLTEIAAEP